MSIAIPGALELQFVASVNQTARICHEISLSKGFGDDRSFGDIISLIHSELSEALEEFRNGHEPTEIYFNGQKPEGIPIELADAVIRIFQYCDTAGIDLGTAIITKMEFNKTRPSKHGGKVI